MRPEYDLLYKPISVTTRATPGATDQPSKGHQSNQAGNNRSNPLSFNDEQAATIAMRANQYRSQTSSQQLAIVDKERDEEADLQLTQDELLGRSNGNYPV